MTPLDFPHKLCEFSNRTSWILPALEHKCLEPVDLHSLAYCLKNLLIAHAIPQKSTVVGRKTAVGAVARAEVRDFENSVNARGVAVVLPPEEIGHFVEQLLLFWGLKPKEGEEFFL